MLVNGLRWIIQKLCPKSAFAGKHAFDDVLAKYGNGHLDEAYSALCEVMEAEPRWSKVGDVYTLWAELELLANHDPARALEILWKADEVGCSRMGYYYAMRAKCLWDVGEHETALDYFEKSVATDGSELHLIEFGQALSCARDARSLDVWEQVLDKNPQNCLAHIYLGCEAAMSGDRERGLLMAAKAEELRPSAEETFDLARVYQELREFKIAIDKYHRAKKLGYKELGPLYAGIADCYLSLNDAASGRKYAERALRYSPDNDYVKEVRRKYEEEG